MFRAMKRARSERNGALQLLVVQLAESGANSEVTVVSVEDEGFGEVRARQRLRVHQSLFEAHKAVLLIRAPVERYPDFSQIVERLSQLRESGNKDPVVPQQAQETFDFRGVDWCIPVPDCADFLRRREQLIVPDEVPQVFRLVRAKVALAGAQLEVDGLQLCQHTIQRS